ncbi:MAG TPA: primosomal protein N' [Candidatus Omnitrophota bacterium]|nr:primosomal protein N' [Candidatus Omnitrophota bacterium]
MKRTVAEIVVPLPVEGPFDYAVSPDMADSMAEGQRVFVPFGRRSLVGFVVGFKAHSVSKILKPVSQLLDKIPSLDHKAMTLARDFSRFYGCSLGEAIETILPAALRKKARWDGGGGVPAVPDSVFFEKEEQSIVCQAFLDERGWAWLCTRIGPFLKKGRGVLVLAPEVLQAQRIKLRLEKEFGADIILLDRRLPAKKELDIWAGIKSGDKRFVVGTRSAVFAPVQDLGLIVVIEDDNRSFKQEQTPFYHVRDIVMMRAAIERTQIVFISFSPSAELMYEARQRSFEIISLLPDFLSQVQVVDLSNYRPQRKTVLSYPVQSRIQEVLKQKGRLLLYFNRRGFNTVTRCSACGEAFRCQRCDIVVPYLFERKSMVCPLCGWTAPLPEACPSCQGKYLRSWGVGLEKLESECARIFPEARVVRVDKDTSRVPKGGDIIVATQAIWRYLDELNFHTVVILDFDAELSRPDFRCGQQAFGLLTRLRKSAEHRLIIQTHQPDNYILTAVKTSDSEAFYKKELKLRQETALPPFQHLVEVTLRGGEEDAVREYIQLLYEKLLARQELGLEILAVQPDFRPKLRDQYRFMIMLKTLSLEKAHALIKDVQRSLKRRGRLIMTVQVDP